MRKVRISILFLIVVMLALAGCSKEQTLKEIFNDETSIRGVIKEVESDTILMESRERTHSGDIRISRRTKNEKGQIDFGVGDKITVYYDGNIAESDPAQINTVFAFKMDEKAEVILEEVDETAEIPEVDEGKIGFDDEDYYSMPILTSVKGDESTELTEAQSAFTHEIINSVEWDKGAKENFKSEYMIMDDLEVVVSFNSESHILNDTENDISVELYKGLSEALKKALDGELK